MVSDGLGASAGATVTITATEPVPALAAGSGPFVQAPAGLPFVGINGSTGTTQLQAASCGLPSAPDLMPDGVARLLSVAGTAGARQLYRCGADGLSISRQAVKVPEGMDFAPDGTLYVSQRVPSGGSTRAPAWAR
ncbi:MAG: hypothetical protein RL227_109 [Pseudomonadota bacterium]